MSFADVAVADQELDQVVLLRATEFGLASFSTETAVAGAHRVQWDGADTHGRSVAQGVYFAHVFTGGATATRRLVLVR